MRIALCLEWSDPATGGQALWTMGFAAHLLAAGHEVHVLACDAPGAWPQVASHRVARDGSPLARAARFNAALARLAPEAVYDAGIACWPGLLHPHTGSNLQGLDREIATEPPLRRLRAALSPRMALLRHRMAELERRQCETARRIVAVSPLVRGLLARRHPAQADKIVVVPNGVDAARFTPEDRAALREPERARLGIGDDTLFLAAGHNLRLKGLDTALRALAELIAGGAKASLAVAGGLPAARENRLVAELGLAGHVRFLGQVGDMRPLFAASDALVHPTRWDACSLIVLEALASGLPAITTRANGAADVIDHGVNGFVLDDPEDWRGLAGLMRTLRDDALRARLAGPARAAGAARDIGENYRLVESALIACAEAGQSAASAAR